MNRKEYRVPLADIPVIPLFVTGESREIWLKEHNVTVELDWAGRPSVDLETAWRLKDLLDRQQELVLKEERKRAEHDAAVAAAQREADETFHRVFTEVCNVKPSGVEATVAARQAVMDLVKKLPRDVAGGVFLRNWSPIPGDYRLTAAP